VMLWRYDAYARHHVAAAPEEVTPGGGAHPGPGRTP
jgi:hypothetical protein